MEVIGSDVVKGVILLTLSTVSRVAHWKDQSLRYFRLDNKYQDYPQEK